MKFHGKYYKSKVIGRSLNELFFCHQMAFDFEPSPPNYALNRDEKENTPDKKCSFSLDENSQDSGVYFEKEKVRYEAIPVIFLDLRTQSRCNSVLASVMFTILFAFK